MNNKIRYSIYTLCMSVISINAFADGTQEVQDMSDPLAVYTQAGVGITDKGINFKFGQTYDSGKENVAAMNVLEIKGVGGDILGIRDNDEPFYGSVDNSIDSFRFRNFQANMTNGRGNQLDISYNVDNEALDASYSILQALPKMGPVNLYPLAGVGVTVANDYSEKDEGYEIPGTFTVVGMYAKVALTDKIWINYNPMYMHTLSGSDKYKDTYFGNESGLLAHEFAVSYQITPRSNIRYFANWNENIDFGDGDHRIEYNYQF
ncbi:hypothetical protein CGI87_15725 [Vibrio parahaemolyticus]|nr:hypothetical protein [Vibrio parahaemolyticus]TOH16477.1 hypothetical protein CGI87_15725 [Vibrio parahaemolyticus]